MLGDPLLTPALNASQVGLGQIDGHAGRLSVDIGEVTVQDVFGIAVLVGDLTEAVAPAVEFSFVLDTCLRVGDGAADTPTGGFGDDAGVRGASAV
jgi:hypothetical protein